MLPVTRTKLGYVTHVVLDGVLPVTSYVQCEQIRLVSTERFIRHVASLGAVDLVRVETVLRRILEL